MNKLIHFGLERKVSTLMFFLALFFLGIIILPQLSWELYPEIQSPRLIVTAGYQGLPAEQIRKLITIPLEDSLSTLPGLKNIRSRSENNSALLEIDFEWGTDMSHVGIVTREKLDLAYLTLPQGASKPFLLPYNPDQTPLALVEIHDLHGDLSFTKGMAEREIKSLLSQISGIGQVVSFGGTDDEVKIQADPGLLANRGLTFNQLLQTLSENQGNYPIGNITQGNLDFMVQTKAQATTLDEIKNMTLLGIDSQSPIKIQDIAQVSLGPMDQKAFFYSKLGEGVILKVYKQPGANPITTLDALKKGLAGIQSSFQSQLDVRILYDIGPMILENLQGVLVSGLLGALLSFLVLWLFLKNILASVLVGLTIPLSVILVFVGFFLTNTGINILSLGGLAMGIGLMVDNSVVVIENLRGLHSLTAKNLASKVQEMAGSTLGSSITTVIVFVPLFLLPGMLGAVFKDLAWAVILSIAASYLVGVFLLPTLLLFFKSFWKPLSDHHLKGLEKWYDKSLKSFLRKPLLGISFLLLIMTASILLFSQINFAVFPNENRVVRPFVIDFPPNTSPQRIKQIGKNLQDNFSQYRELNFWIEGGGFPGDPYILSDPKKNPTQIRGEVFLPILSPRWDETIKTLLQNTVSLPVTWSFMKSPHPLDRLLGLDNTGSVLQIYGENPDASRVLAYGLSERNSWDTDWIQPKLNNQQILMTPDRLAQFSKGTNLAEIAQTLFTALMGQTAGEYAFRHKDIQIRVFSGSRYLSSIEELNQFSWASSSGILKLGELVTLDTENSLEYFSRDGRRDYTQIHLPAGTKPPAASESTKEISNNVFTSNFQNILYMLGFGLVLLFLVMGFQFESFRLPLLILTVVPISLGGIILGLLLFSQPFTFFSGMGVLILLGLTVNVEIILIENYQRLNKADPHFPGRIVRSSVRRLVPILITTLTTLLAMVPFTIDLQDTSSQDNLSITIISGLLASLIFSLYVFPWVYLSIHKKKE